MYFKLIHCLHETKIRMNLSTCLLLLFSVGDVVKTINSCQSHSWKRGEWDDK